MMMHTLFLPIFTAAKDEKYFNKSGITFNSFFNMVQGRRNIKNRGGEMTPKLESFQRIDRIKVKINAEFPFLISIRLKVRQSRNVFSS